MNSDSDQIAKLRAEFEREVSPGGAWLRAIERDRDGAYLLLATDNAWREWLRAMHAMRRMGWIEATDSGRAT